MTGDRRPPKGVASNRRLAADAPLRLAEQRRRWREKPALREVYGDLHRRLLAACPAGSVLEIGSGSGGLRDSVGANRPIVSIDVTPNARMDLRADAHALPFAASSFDSIVMLDALHHFQSPPRFFREATRVVRAGGCIVMIEPAVTPVSSIFYRAFHAEPVDTSADPYAEAPLCRNRRAFDGNQAVPTLLFADLSDPRFARQYPGLRLESREWLSLWAYPLSGGFRRWRLLPARLVAPLLRFEGRLLPRIGRFAAFRLFVVLRRVDSPGRPGT